MDVMKYLRDKQY